MSTYRMEDGTVVKSENATASWDEDTEFDGHNHISVATGSEWAHERLHRSRKGRYWIERWSDWQGSTPSAEWVSPRTAASWLLANGEDLPADLEAQRENVEE